MPKISRVERLYQHHKLVPGTVKKKKKKKTLLTLSSIRQVQHSASTVAGLPVYFQRKEDKNGQILYSSDALMWTPRRAQFWRKI